MMAAERKTINRKAVIGKPGPFKIIESEPDGPIGCQEHAPIRRHECSNYQSCLSLAAALNWDNFTCRGCNQEINQSLYWKANQAKRKDDIVDRICSVPDIRVCSSNSKDAA